MVEISAFESPNFTDEDIPDNLRPLLIGKTWVEEKRKSWGEASPMWRVRILGKFPEIGDDTLIPPPWIAGTRDRELETKYPVELGVDVARFGVDETVILHRRGPVAQDLWDATPARLNGRMWLGRQSHQRTQA